jgi:hypothetical protein
MDTCILYPNSKGRNKKLSIRDIYRTPLAILFFYSIMEKWLQWIPTTKLKPERQYRK